jgi:hypothetical protein
VAKVYTLKRSICSSLPERIPVSEVEPFSADVLLQCSSHGGNVDGGTPVEYATSMKFSRICSLTVAALWLSHVAGGLDREPVPELQLQASDEGEHFQYSISHAESVHAAWIEVVDRPDLIDKKSIPIQPSGELNWEWKWEKAAFLHEEEDEDALMLGLWDPDGVSLWCDGLAIHLERGGGVSARIASGRMSFDPAPSLESLLVRVRQGSQRFRFAATGKDFTATTKFHVFTEKNAKCEDRFVHARVIDLAHARFTIDRQCLIQPGILFVSTNGTPDPSDMNRVWIHVASLTGPRLRSVSPASVRENEPPGQLKLVLRGKNFTKDSTVDADYMPDGLDYNVVSQLNLETQYVSPTELHARVHVEVGDTSLVRTLGWNRTAFRIWVEGKAENFELSESRDVEVLQANGEKRRQVAVITSISPFPIPLMDEHSPNELKITIHGENFVRENTLAATFGTQSGGLRMKYVSPTTLRAWLPRQYWRRHHIVYRLVVETTAGRQYSREMESSDDE